MQSALASWSRVAACAALVLAAAAGDALAQAKPRPSTKEKEKPQAEDDAPAEAAAADDEADERDPVEVRVIGDKADAMQKVPGSANIIRPREIDRAQPNDAAEILRRVPGVYVRQDPGAGGRLDIGVRGLDPGRSRRVLVLEDGVPISNNPYGEPDLYYAPPVERMRAVEVVKGSGSILFGPQTVGGVINFITPFAPSRREATLEVKGGERGYFQALGRYGDSFGSARYLSQILFRRGDGFREQGFEALNAFGKLSIDTGPRGEATLKIGVHDERADSDDVGLTAAMFAADPRRATLAPHDRLKLRRYEVSLTHDQRFDDVVSLRTLAYAYTLSRLWRRQDYERFASPDVFYERIVGDVTVPEGAIYFRNENRILDRSYEVAGLEPRLELRFENDGVGQTIDVGARVLAEGAHEEQRAGQTPVSESGALLLDETRSAIAVAGYLQDRIAFLDDMLLVTPGVRVEHVRYRREIDRRPTADGAEDVDIVGKSNSTAFIPGIGMTAGIPEMHGFAGFHVGYAPPRLTTSIRPNGESERLDSERSLTYEVGTRLRQEQLWRLELTGFFSSFANQVVPATAGETTELVNGGQTRHYGLESEVGAGFGELFDVGLFLDVTTRYTLMRGEFVNGARDGLRLPYAPSHLLSAVLDVGHDVGVAAQLAYGYVGSMFADELNTEAEDVTGRTGLIEGYHLIDAGLRYHNAFTGLTASVAVKSLMDQPFIIARRPEGIFASGFRQVMFGLRWDYAETNEGERR
jgi:Fe(3+) dicitrate transport protein